MSYSGWASCGLALEAGHVEHKEGDPVEYYSSWHQEWMNVIVLQADDKGRLKLTAEPGCSKFELKPNTWLSKSSVDTKIRPRSKPDAAVDSACAKKKPWWRRWEFHPGVGACRARCERRSPRRRPPAAAPAGE